MEAPSPSAGLPCLLPPPVPPLPCGCGLLLNMPARLTPRCCRHQKAKAHVFLDVGASAAGTAWQPCHARLCCTLLAGMAALNAAAAPSHAVVSSDACAPRLPPWHLLQPS